MDDDTRLGSGVDPSPEEDGAVLFTGVASGGQSQYVARFMTRFARLDLLDPLEVARLGGIEVTTEGVVEDADAQRPPHRRRYQPRTSSRSSSARELAEMPTIGSPSPAETSASTFGSS